MNYGREQFEMDILAVRSAQDRLSALTLGERLGECAKFGPDYARISNYFLEDRNGVLFGVPQSTKVARMFVNITEGNGIQGFETVRYETLLKEVEAKLKSMRVFRRKMKKKCSQPGAHRQPCYCAAMKESTEAYANREIAPIHIHSGLNGLKAVEQHLRETVEL